MTNEMEPGNIEVFGDAGYLTNQTGLSPQLFVCAGVIADGKSDDYM